MGERIGDTKRPPYPSVACIEARFADESRARGTGFFVDSLHLLTSGHVLFDRASGMARSVIVSPARNGEAMPFGAFSAERCFVPDEFRERNDAEFDYGLIQLRTEARGVPLWLTLAVVPDEALQDREVATTGYPADRPEGTMWQDVDEIVVVKPSLLFFKDDLAAGASGAPVHFYDALADRTYVVGIRMGASFHLTGAVRLTPDLLARVRGWTGSAGAL